MIVESGRMTRMPMWVKGLTPDLMKKAEVELGETPEVRKKSVKELLQMIEGDVGFTPCTDEPFLVRFLRAKKYDVNRAFKSLKCYYAFKVKHPEMFQCLPSECKPVLEKSLFLVSPKRLPNDGGVLVLFVGSSGPDVVSLEEIVRAVFVSIEVGMDADPSQVVGNTCVIDFKGMTWKKLMHFSSPSFLYMLAKGLQECWPVRMGAIHLVHEPSYVGFTWKIVKPMLTKKLRDRIYFHGSNLKNLHKMVCPEILPEQLGGELGEKEFKEFTSRILAKEQLVKQINDYTFDGVKSAAKDQHSKKKRNSLTKLLIKQLSFDRKRD